MAAGCDALVIATEWPVFKKLDLERARRLLTHPILFDGRNLFDPKEMEEMGFIYKSVYRPLFALHLRMWHVASGHAPTR